MRIFEAAALAGLVVSAACAHRQHQETARAPEQTAAPQPPQATAQQPAAQQPAAQPRAQQPATAAQRPLADQCVELLDGRIPTGVDVVALRTRCEALVRRGEIEGMQAGVATAQPESGSSALAAFTQAGSELVGGDGRRTVPGSTARGAVNNTLTTNPLGWFSGLGVNLAYMRPFRWDRASWDVSGRYSRTNSSNGRVTAFGLGGGLDLFVFGRNNEGLRVGPRLDLAYGRETIQGSTDFARLGASGELGYNFIASNGISASVAGGYGGRLAGDAQDEDFWNYTGGEDGPYLKLGLGYSW